jgi:hypothetical protein
MKTRFTVKAAGNKFAVYDKARKVTLHPCFSDQSEASDYAMALNVCLL